MKKLLSAVILTLLFASCKKEACKRVTIETINGCDSPIKITYIMKDQVVCGSELADIQRRNPNTYVDMPGPGGGTCRITTLIIIQ